MNQSRDHSLVTLSGVSHQFDGTLVIRNINWSINPGERWGLLGPTGAGKTTLARIAAGYLWPNEGGTVTREGRHQYNLSEWRKRVGWLSTDLLDRIPANQTLKDTVLAGSLGQTRLAQRPDLTLSDEDRQRVDRLLENVNLAHKHKQSFSDLSRGETNLALVARALAANPALIVFDEPCDGMDPGAREHFLSILDDTLEEHPSAAAVYITHHVEEILPSFGRVLTLKNGDVLKAGDKENIITADRLEELYGVSFQLTRRSQRYWAMT